MSVSCAYKHALLMELLLKSTKEYKNNDNENKRTLLPGESDTLPFQDNLKVLKKRAKTSFLFPYSIFMYLSNIFMSFALKEIT